MYICVPSECLVLCRGQKQELDTLKLGLRMIMNHQVGARNWTRVHCESNEFSTSLSPPNLFSNLPTFLNISLFTSSKHGNFSTTQLFTLSSSLGEKLKAENSEVNNLRDKIRVNCIFWLLVHLQAIWQVFMQIYMQVLYYVLRQRIFFQHWQWLGFTRVL